MCLSQFISYESTRQIKLKETQLNFFDPNKLGTQLILSIGSLLLGNILCFCQRDHLIQKFVFGAVASASNL